MKDQDRKDAALATLAALAEIRRADSNALLSHKGTHAAGDSDAAYVALVSAVIALAE